MAAVVVALGLAVLSTAWFWWRRRGAERVSVVPAGSLLGEAERRFLEAARRALSPEFEIFAKVGLAEVLRPAPGTPALLRRAAVELLRAERADFVVCQRDDGRIAGLIELDGKTDGGAPPAFFDQAVARAGLPLLRVAERKDYDTESLRQQALATFRPAARAAKVRTMVRRGTVWLRIEGHGTFQNSATVRAYGEQMFEAGHRSFAFDLHACEMMDSTFLGTLTGLALRLREDPRGRVGFTRVNGGVESLFTRYGLDRVLAFQGFEAAPPAPDEMQELEFSGTKEFKRGTIVEAHEALAASSPENEERFREALEFLKRKEPE